MVYMVSRGLYHCNCNNSHYTTITVGMTAVSAVTPTIIVALALSSSAHDALSPAVIDSDSKQSLQEEEERP